MLTNLWKRLVTQWMFYLAVAFMFSAILLRTLVVYRGHAALPWAVLLLVIWLLLLLSEPAVSRQWRGYFPVYWVLQTGLLTAMLSLPVYPDYFAGLFSILSVQIVQKYRFKISALLIAPFTPITIIMFIPSLGLGQAIVMGVFYTGVNALMASFATTVKRARRVREQNLALMQELAASNQQLQTVAAQMEGLAVARERSNLARELHDSVTQTVFSMTLTAKSALMLVDRDFNRVSGQIERLNQLAQSAQAEMRLLIAELGPEKSAHEDLPTVIRRHLQLSNFPETFTVDMDVSGSGALTMEENRNLFRIVQEALNNAQKHANASRTAVRLHLEEPFWVEIEDNGSGFDPQQVFDVSHMGLRGMRERAAAIHWGFTVCSAPGANTRIHIEKLDSKGASD
jgi:signal transduction histidine kinase